jgi:uncharacterized protein (DUF58 family)
MKAYLAPFHDGWQMLHLRWQALRARWLARRIPAAREIRLDQRRIFIFPTRAGALYLLLLLVLLLTAINYQSNGIYLLSFMLAGQFVAAIMATYSNLSGLQLHRGTPTPGYAGERVTFRVSLQRDPAHCHRSLRIGWPGQVMVRSQLEQRQETVVEIYHGAHRRGLLQPGRLLLETVYPLGLLRAWTWLDLNMECWVYPRPQPTRNLPVAERAMGHHEQPSLAQQDEFSNIRPWRRHDAPRQILWKAYAKDQPLMTMEFSDRLRREVWLDEALVRSGSREERLSVLCYAALQLSEQGLCFGLRLAGGEVIAAAQGDEHQRAVLILLASQPGGEGT